MQHNNYQELIEKGRTLPPFPEEEKIESHRVLGCQSVMYLFARLEEGKVHFFADSDALISKGLAAVLIDEVSGKSPEEILTYEPKALEKLSFALTLGRQQGLASLWLTMKQRALSLLLK